MQQTWLHHLLLSQLTKYTINLMTSFIVKLTKYAINLTTSFIVKSVNQVCNKLDYITELSAHSCLAMYLN